MTTTPQRRTLLPLLGPTRHGSRSWATCHYRCDNACDKPEPNTSANPHVQDVITGALRRRSFPVRRPSTLRSRNTRKPAIIANRIMSK